MLFQKRCILKPTLVGEMKVLISQSCPTLSEPIDCSLPGSSVCGILQARILACVAFPFSRTSSLPRDQTCASHIAGRFFTIWATREALGWSRVCVNRSINIEIIQKSSLKKHNTVFKVFGILLKLRKNKGRFHLLFSALNSSVQKRPSINWPPTSALFLTPIPTAPWILFHHFVLWSTHNRCFVAVCMLKAERKNGTFVRLSGDNRVCNWWCAWEPLRQVPGSPLMDGQAV